MEFSSIFLAVSVIILGFLWFHQRVQAKKFPPGPWGLPIVGYLPFLSHRAYETFLQLGEKYGSIYSVVLGMQRVVVLNDWAAVKAALVDQAHMFSGRPSMFILDSVVKKRDITTNHGPIWKTQRIFAIQALKRISPEKSDGGSYFMESVNDLTDKLERQNGRIMCFQDDIFFLPILNIVWKMVCNKEIEDGDEEGRFFYSIVKENVYGFRNNSPVNFIPFLRYLVPGGFGYWTYVKHHNMLWNFLEKEIEEHRRTFKAGECRDLLDAYIEEIQEREQRNGKAEPPFTTDHLAGTLFDFLLAGTDTSSNTLTWAIQILSVWPDIQEKIQAEMDEVIGRGRAPVLQDMPMLPYLEAVTLEIHRYVSLVPLSIFHSPLKDTEVLGHPIPKGCTVIQNIYGVHRDPKCWEEPFEFNPERFMDSQNGVKKPAFLIPFSVGARICLGESLTKQIIFLFLACILQKLSFRLPPNSPPPSWKPIVGLTLTPQPFSVIVNVR